MGRGESNFQKKLLPYLEHLGAYVIKIHNDGHMRSGTPDVIMCYRGLFVALELKNPRIKNPYKGLSDEQAAHIVEITKAAGLAYAVSSMPQVIAIVRHIDSALEGKS